MTSRIKNPKDFWTGVMYVGLGGTAVMLSRSYTIGTAVRMGPGYFPTVLGGLLFLIGLIAMVRSFIAPGEKIAPFAWKGLVLALGAVLLFGFLIKGAGFAPAVFFLVLVSASAHEKFELVPAIVLAVGMTIFSVLIFITGLRVPMQTLGTWFGN